MDTRRQIYQMLRTGLSSIEDGIIRLGKSFGKDIKKRVQPKINTISPDHQMYQMVEFGMRAIAEALSEIDVTYVPVPDKDFLTKETTLKIISDNLPKKGVQYFTEQEVQDFIAKVSKLIPPPQNGKDAVVDYDKILNFVRTEFSKIPPPKDGEPGKDAVVDYESIISNVLSKIVLPKPEKVDYDEVKKFIIEEIKKLPKGGLVRQFFGGGGGMANPMTTQGDIIYGGSSGTPTRLPGNSSTTVKVLTQQGNGTAPNAPTWEEVSLSSTGGFGAILDAGVGVTLEVGTSVKLIAENAFQPTEWKLYGDTIGDLTLDVWRNASSFPVFSSDSICNSNYPNVISGGSYADGSATDWDALDAEDFLVITVTAATGTTGKVTLQVLGNKL